MQRSMTWITYYFALFVVWYTDWLGDCCLVTYWGNMQDVWAHPLAARALIGTCGVPKGVAFAALPAGTRRARR